MLFEREVLQGIIFQNVKITKPTNNTSQCSGRTVVGPGPQPHDILRLFSDTDDIKLFSQISPTIFSDGSTMRVSEHCI